MLDSIWWSQLVSWSKSVMRSGTSMRGVDDSTGGVFWIGVCGEVAEECGFEKVMVRSGTFGDSGKVVAVGFTGEDSLSGVGWQIGESGKIFLLIVGVSGVEGFGMQGEMLLFDESEWLLLVVVWEGVLLEESLCLVGFRWEVDLLTRWFVSCEWNGRGLCEEWCLEEGFLSLGRISLGFLDP